MSENNSHEQHSNPNDDGNPLWGVLGLFFPLVGLIIYLVWMKERPKSARSALIGTIIGFVLHIGIIACFGFFGSRGMFFPGGMMRHMMYW
ncbi:hypothetical protein QUW13_06080 [Enterococcus hirae]|jgi:hypothetical protein|nr:hypothetical protein [Enterococcaceae bacterium]MCI1919568.1 hypothetical protein [Enterococcaceae bacterium]MDM8213439.1 hypothetical protein [Enterococcus hirae]